VGRVLGLYGLGVWVLWLVKWWRGGGAEVFICGL